MAREPAPVHGASTEKRRTILAAALKVFSREGYTRATIEMIAAEANASTRTIYNYFSDKQQLFVTVIQESATRVAEAHIALIDRHLRQMSDLESDLVRLGQDWLRPIPDYADHHALVRHIRAEAGRIPREALEAWQETGPLRVRREFARHLRALSERGVLRIDDAERAALHYTVLISAGTRPMSGESPAEDEVAETVAAGVRVFLNGYVR